MVTSVNDNLHVFGNIDLSYSDKKAEFSSYIFKLHLDDNTSILFDNVSALPDSIKGNLKDVFKSVVEKKQVQKDLLKNPQNSLKIGKLDDKIVYVINGSVTKINDSRLLKKLDANLRKAKKYLTNVEKIEKKPTKEEIDFYKSSATTIDKVSKKTLLEHKKSDSEWSLWAIWAMESRSAVNKFCNAFHIDIASILDCVPSWAEDILGYYFAGFGILNGIEQESDSRKIGDKEGMWDGRHKINRNLIAMIGGAIQAIGKTLASLALTVVGSALFIFIAIYATLRYVYFAISAMKFRNKLNAYLKNDKLTDEEKLKGAINYLKSKVTITQAETAKVLKKVKKQYPNESDEKIKKIANNILKNKLLVKLKRFERRVGGSVLAAKIQKNSDDYIKNYAAKRLEIEKLINRVKDKNKIIFKENKWYAAATILQAIEISVVLALGFTTVAAVCGAVSSSIFALILLAYFYRKYVSRSEEDKQDQLSESIDLIADPAI
ncbi:MAG: hypothetical protein JXA94_03335 [Parachlamydiales bacterium]|nr:hypothetical protein [Parachlamydiales bacterium]